MHCPRISTICLAAVIIGNLFRSEAIAQTVDVPVAPPRADDWFSVPADSVRLFAVQSAAPPSINLPTIAADEETDIESPGPDMGDFPNSAFTLPKGRAYVEMAP